MAQPPIVTAYAGTTPWKNTSPALNPAGTLFTPNLVSGLALWLDGNDVNGDGTSPGGTGSKISSWVNKASNIYTCTQATASNQPTFANPGILFSNENKGAGFTIQGHSLTYSSSNNNETIYMVLNYNYPATVTIMNLLYPNKLYGRQFTIDNLNVLTTSKFGIGVILAKGTLSQNTTTLVNSLISPTQVTHYQNGTNEGSSNTTTFTNADLTFLGNDNYNGTSCFNGTMYEVLIYSNTLADNDRYSIETYLYQKWNFNLNSSNPYKNMKNYNYPLLDSNFFFGTKYVTSSSNNINILNYPLISNSLNKFPNTLSNAPFP